jgi:hypothetical protein
VLKTVELMWLWLHRKGRPGQGAESLAQHSERPVRGDRTVGLGFCAHSRVDVALRHLKYLVDLVEPQKEEPVPAEEPVSDPRADDAGVLAAAPEAADGSSAR